MTETPEAAATPEPAPPTPPPSEPVPPNVEDLKVIIRPWPKVIFLYPTLICSVICWFILLIQGDPGAVDTNPAAVTETVTPTETGAAANPAGAEAESSQEDPSILGNVFMIVFFLNLLVFSFDFSRIKSITILVAVIGLGFGLAWADGRWGVTTGIMSALGQVNIQMNAQFYGWMAAFLFVSLLLVLINTRFNYYEINHREILHHHGYLGDITRVPTHGLRFNKEIYDLVEFALLRSGRLIFVTPTSHEAIVIDNVPNVNVVEDQIKNLLSVVAVRMA